MSGQVNYNYDKEDGSLPTHTKSSFYRHKILTIQGIIVKNALVFMHQVINFKNNLPPSITGLIRNDAPCFSASPNYESNLVWNEKYNSVLFRSSIFFKGPLLVLNELNQNVLSPTSAGDRIIGLKSYKNMVKAHLLEQQNTGEPDQWPTFPLNDIKGLRCSTR